MHHKFCSKPPVAFDKMEVPKKATAMREQQLNEYDRLGRFTINIDPSG